MGTNLGDLLAKAGLVASPGAQQAEPEPTADRAPEVCFAPKVVVRRSRKGHGGKTVTVVSGVVHGELLLKDLKRELGVGARVDGDELVVQGNQVDRVGQWLEKRGATGVVLSH